MSEERKSKLLKSFLNGANLDHAQIVVVLESGVTVSYNGNQTNEKNQLNTHQHASELIINYVDRLKPMVRNEYLDTYDKLWMGILELDEVKVQVFEKGKQQGTDFNRNLVAQIIHQLSAKIYLPTANTVNMAERLEPGKGANHSVRQKLGEVPDEVIKKSVERFLEKFF